MRSNKLKLVGFDSWLGGCNHFQRLIPALNDARIDFTLVHISSWGNDTQCEEEDKIGDVTVRDISFYGNSLEKVLDVEKPDAVIFLSTDTFAHRAFNRYCIMNSIPTLNLYHGILGVLDTLNKQSMPKVSPRALVANICSKLPKLFRYTFPVYISALLRTNATLKDWTKFLTDCFRLAIGSSLWFGRAANDAKTTRCAVYVQNDVEHAIQYYGFEKKQITVVGNPDIVNFGLDRNMLNSWVNNSGSKKKVMYIECGFSSLGLVYDGTDGFVKHLISTSEALRRQGFTMQLKLKPNQLNTKKIEKRLSDTGIELISNHEFLSSLMNCDGCIVETTSLAIMPALLGMPIMLGGYGVLQSTVFGGVLTSYPRAYRLPNIESFSKILLESLRVDVDKEIESWLDLNAGPAPFEAMPKRVVSIIEDLIV